MKILSGLYISIKIKVSEPQEEIWIITLTGFTSEVTNHGIPQND